jgi:hypothetical protein
VECPIRVLAAIVLQAIERDIEHPGTDENLHAGQRTTADPRACLIADYDLRRATTGHLRTTRRQLHPVPGFSTVVEMKARRSPWINDRTKLLLSYLDDCGFTLPEDAARQLISDHLDGVAARMRIGRQAARFYVTDEVIQKIVDKLVGALPSESDDRNVVSLAALRRERRQRWPRSGIMLRA